jgi:hypothetical protein
VITLATVKDHLDDLIAGKVDDLRFAHEERGAGSPLDVDELEAALAPIAAGSKDFVQVPEGDLDQLEGKLSVVLLEALKAVPISALDDPGFWAYLATGCLWPFVRLREPPESRAPERYLVYIDGRSSTECVPLRMFLRARALDRIGKAEMAGGIPGAVDFWRSHVIRVRTGSHPVMVGALVEQQSQNRLTTGPVRIYAKRINRRWSNQVLYLLNEVECARVAQSEREGLDDL